MASDIIFHGQFSVDNDISNGLCLGGVYVPEEILLGIFTYLNYEDILRCSLVCKRWCNIAKSNILWQTIYNQVEHPKKAKNLPWYVFYCYFTSKEYFTNLVKNGNGQNKFEHWIISKGQFRIEDPPDEIDQLPEGIPGFNGFSSCFATSYANCSKYQMEITYNDYPTKDLEAIIFFHAGHDERLQGYHGGKMAGGVMRFVFESIDPIAEDIGDQAQPLNLSTDGCQIWQKEYQLVIENIAYSIILFLTLAKVIVCQTWEVKDLITRCILEEKMVLNDKVAAQIQENFVVYVKHLKRMYFIYLPVPTAALLSYHGVSYVNYTKYNNLNSSSEKPLTMAMKYPFDTNQYYGTALSIGAYLGTIGAIYTVVPQILFLSLTTYTIWQLKTLQIYGKNYHVFNQLGESNSTENSKENILGNIKGICEKHQNIIRFVDELNLALRNILMVEYLLNSVNIASVIIRTMMSISLSDALFQSKWYEQSEKIKRTIFIIMIRCRKPLQVFIGPFYPMTIRTALTTMKAAYSCVTLLFSMILDDS